jgi:hypothetical protein
LPISHSRSPAPGSRPAGHSKGIGQSVRDAADQLARFAPAIGTIGAAGTIAGVAALARGFGQFGIQTVKTAAALDLSVKDVQSYSRAWEKAGLSAEEFVQSHASINKALVERRAYGGPALSAANYAKALGLGSVDINKDPETVRKQVADIVKRMHLAGVNVETQMSFAEAFNISRDEISLLQRGVDGIEDLKDQAAATVVVSDELVERGKKLGESLIGLGQSAETAGWKIAGDLEPALRPLIDGFASLLINIDKIPGGMGTAETAIGGLFALFTVEVAARMKTVRLALWGIKAALGGLAALSIPAWLGGLLGAGAGIATFLGRLAERGRSRSDQGASRALSGAKAGSPPAWRHLPRRARAAIGAKAGSRRAGVERPDEQLGLAHQESGNAGADEKLDQRPIRRLARSFE